METTIGAYTNTERGFALYRMSGDFIGNDGLTNGVTIGIYYWDITTRRRFVFSYYRLEENGFLRENHWI